MLASPRAAVLVALAGALWAAFCLTLSSGGHAPSVTLLPIPRERYYLFEAAIVVPVLLGQWLATAAIASRLARTEPRATATGLAYAMALPLVTLFLLPDAIVYALWGFEALGRLVVVTAPLLLVSTIAGSALTLSRLGPSSRARAWLSAAVAVVIPAAIAGIILR